MERSGLDYLSGKRVNGSFYVINLVEKEGDVIVRPPYLRQRVAQECPDTLVEYMIREGWGTAKVEFEGMDPKEQRVVELTIKSWIDRNSDKSGVR